MSDENWRLEISHGSGSGFKDRIVLRDEHRTSNIEF